MAADYKTPQWLLPNELNMSLNPALSESRHILYSMDFDGTDDYINLGSSFYQVGSGNVSLSIWIKPESQLGNNDIL